MNQHVFIVSSVLGYEVLRRGVGRIKETNFFQNAHPINLALRPPYTFLKLTSRVT